MAKRTPGFKSAKQKRKSEAVSEAQRRRWDRETLKFDTLFVQDHPYAAVSKRSYPDISNCVNEEIIEIDGSNVTADFSEWRVGRRVVELGVLADGLAACKKCGLPFLCSTINSYGLATILKIVCANTACLNTNLIPTGKRHEKVWDVNSKLAAGKHFVVVNIYDSCSSWGAASEWNFRELNIPTVSHSMLDERQKEIGGLIENVAEESIREWMTKEIALTNECDGTDDLTVSVDAGWQTRGSGRAYNSLTGYRFKNREDFGLQVENKVL
ncbi:unnamed protein product [Mytilus coruscus]|uniref:Mutator-like transposase domain-containing protein n=1 Tax=Mytilus coruscus TaxID=42192 RepID=A0A6J8DU29_MYTCO|nr:unnamed protein product [Mytilus coruscus]